MDSLRKRRFEKPPEKNQIFQQNISIPPAPHREEIFISSKDSQATDTYEKKFQRGRLMKKIIFILMIAAIAVFLSYVSFLFFKTYGTFKKISLKSDSEAKSINLTEYAREVVSPIIPKEKQMLRGEESGRINILLLGAAGEKKPGNNLTDTIMLMSVDTKNKKVSLLSLPRDLYVNIPDSESYSKLNTLYPIGLKQNSGIDLIRSAVSEITGLKINYYLVIDFDSFEKIINDIGGINITNERDIYDPRYPGPNYSYETFSLSKGFHTLDGATALKYVRERHNDPDGDFGRAKRQQQVIQAVKNKIFSARTFLNVIAINDLLNTLGDSVQTDIPLEEMDDFLNLSQEVDMQNINNVVVDAWEKNSLLKVSHVPTANAMMFILVPRVGNYSEIQDLAENIFDLNIIKKRQAEIANEAARIAVINQSGNAQLVDKIKNLLEDKLELKDVDIISSKNKNSLSKTTIFDNSKGAKLFTLDELIKKLPARIATQSVAGGPASLSAQLPNIADLSDYDIVITIGSDLVDVYKYEEDSIEDLRNQEENQDSIMTND
ncbi:MAG TPA: LCP family protein [Candidatus Moranbacteria bacterium]|nr:LCP family protein [Candidatus Moranbacteria bacterium]